MVVVGGALVEMGVDIVLGGIQQRQTRMRKHKNAKTHECENTRMRNTTQGKRLCERDEQMSGPMNVHTKREMTMVMLLV